MTRRTIDPAELARAKAMIDDGASLRATQRATGISTDTLSRRFKRPSGQADGPGGATTTADTPPGRRRKDPPPRARAPRQQRRVKPSDEQLEALLRQLLKFCSIPMRLKCDYCANYMAERAASTARQAVEDQDMRQALEWLYENWERYAGLSALAAWVGVPMIHHLAPEFIYRSVAPIAGMPPRHAQHSSRSGSPPAPGNGASAPATAPPAPEAMSDPASVDVADGAGGPMFPIPPGFVMPAGLEGLEGMDIEQLLATAESFGIQVDPDILEGMLAGNGSADPATPRPADAPPAAGSQAEAEADASDPNAEL